MMKSIISNKKNKKLKKQSNILCKYDSSKKTPPVYKFLDPYQYYYLFGDIVLSNKIWQSSNDAIYHLEILRNYKIIRQIHVREHGLVFELDEIFENSITSIKFLQERLRSLGDTYANNLADFLDFYQDYFKNTPFEVFDEETNDFEEPKLFDWIDKIFEINKGNLFFLKGHFITKKKDFKTKFLGFSYKLIAWLTNESNIFSEDFIRDCFRFPYVKNIEGFILLLKTIVVQKYKNLSGSTMFMRSFNTLLGKINLLINVQTFLFPQQRMFFHFAVTYNENIDPNLEKKIMMIKMEENKKKKNINTERNESKNYADFMKLYYINKEDK